MFALIPWLVGGVTATITGLFGFVLGGGVSGFSRVVMWGGVLFVSYLVAKQAKVI